jgi:hypothetical protein
MRFKGTTVLFALFIALGAYVYFAEYRGKEARDQKEEAAGKAVQVEPKDITQLTLTYQGMTVTAERRREKGWVLTAPEEVDADSEQLETLVSDVSRVERESVVTADATDLSTYGLAPPTNTVLFKTVDGKQIELHFGAENPKKTSSYARFSDSKEVFLTPVSWSRIFQKTFADLRNKKLLEFEVADVDALKVEDGKNRIDLQKVGTDWLMKVPLETLADGSEVPTFLSSISFGRAQSFAAPSIDVKSAELEPPAIRLTIHEAMTKKDHVLLVGKQVEDGKYFARDASRAPIFIIDKDIVEKVRRPIFEWRDKSIAKIGRDKISEIEIQRGPDKFSFKKEGTNWKLSDGKTLSSDKVSSLLNAIEFEKALQIIDSPGSLTSYGLDKPGISVRFREGSNELLHIAFGSQKKDPDGFYLKSSRDSAVRLVSREVFNKFDVKPEDLLEAKSTTP